MAYTLTASWYKSSTSNYVTVNDVKVDVPYELKNGDIVKIYSSNGDAAGIFLNGKSISNYDGIIFNDSIDLSNTDIDYSERMWGPTPYPSLPIITINYTEQSIPSTDTKPIFKRINGTWVKQDAFQRISGAWVRISTKETTETFLLTTSSNEILQDSNGNNLEFTE